MFGWFIVNSDMYVGNFLFYYFDVLMVFVFVYDMLLMVYVLVVLGMLCYVFVDICVEVIIDKKVWEFVLLLVECFWVLVVDDKCISVGF